MGHPQLFWMPKGGPPAQSWEGDWMSCLPPFANSKGWGTLSCFGCRRVGPPTFFTRLRRQKNLYNPAHAKDTVEHNCAGLAVAHRDPLNKGTGSEISGT